ncbi:MAG: adenosylmethionine--8-amino-7-oxononanoate transaminase [Deltaproteobacteria bacterium]|nr:MAG: adenosylmethionine--8-amino-7-oxononanoate transaminase [Deltaproteobacteria bacterium]
MHSDRTADLAARDKAHVWHPFTQQQQWAESDPLFIERGEGSYLIDTDGEYYLDGVSSLWTNVHGHGRPELDEAIRRQLERIAHSTFLGLSHPLAVDLAEKLVAIAPHGLNRVFYSDNGSTSTEIAVKMAFQAQQQRGETQRVVFATLQDAYHGDTLGAVSVGSIALFHRVFGPLLFETVSLPAPTTPGGDEEAKCLAEAQRILAEQGDRLAGFIFEPLVQGAAGMKMHSPAYLRPLLEQARSQGALLIADEVATGFGRTGTMFAMEQVGLSPDLLCTAKGLSGGYLPLAATLATEAVYEAFLASPAEYKQFFHGHTFTANPLGCAVALASLDLFERDDTLGHVRAMSEQLAHHLGRLSRQPGVRAIRQRGVMIGVDLCAADGSDLDPAALTGHRVCMDARPRGAVLRPLGDTIVLMPILSMSEGEITDLMRILSESIAAVVA